MAKSAENIKRYIAGQEFPLKSDNLELLDKVVDEVNNQIDIVAKKNPSDTPILKVSILAALNIAEKQILDNKQASVDREYITGELERMAEFLRENFQNEKVS